jgi:hypothetical protein
MCGPFLLGGQAAIANLLVDDDVRAMRSNGNRKKYAECVQNNVKRIMHNQK